MYARITGNLIQKSEVETLRLENPNCTPKEIGAMLGVSEGVIYQFYRQHGWGKQRPKRAYPIHYSYGEPLKSAVPYYPTVTASEIMTLLAENPNLTTSELATALDTSISQIEKVKRESHIKSDHKGRKIPLTEEKLKDKIVYHVLHTGNQRQEIASKLGVTPPTIGNYVKQLKKEGRIPAEFSFRKRVQTK